VTELIEAVALDLTQQWLADIGLRDLLGPQLAQPIAAAIGALTATVGDDPTKVLLLGAGLPDNPGWVDVGHIADMIRQGIPDSLRTAGLAMGAAKATTPPPGEIASGAEETWSSLLELLTGSPPGRADAPILAAMSSGGPPKAPGPGRDPASVVKALMLLLERLAASAAGPNIRRALEDLGDQADDLAWRIAAAEALAVSVSAAAAGSRGILVPSSKELGSWLHREWQTDYRRHLWNARHRIVQDGRVFGPGFPPDGKQLARGVISAQVGLADADLKVLYMARQARLLAGGGRGSLREDQTDLTLASVWEIKPITHAVEGVVQEFLYRNAYNIYSAHLDDRFNLGAAGVHVCTPSQLKSGGAWPPPQPQLKYSSNVLITRQPLPVIAYPVQWTGLPGLVLYLTLSFPARLMAKLALQLRQLIGEVLDAAKRLAADAERWWNRNVADPVFAAVAGSFIMAVIAAVLTLLLRLPPSPSPSPAGVVPPILDPGSGGRDPYMTRTGSDKEQGNLTLAGIPVPSSQLSAPGLARLVTTLEAGMRAACGLPPLRTPLTPLA
jgi:hypothetical protein